MKKKNVGMMRFISLIILLTSLVYLSVSQGQTEITFEDEEWGSDQSLDSTLILSTTIFTSNKNFYTNYGYNFDVYNVSIYFVFQNQAEDKITIKRSDNKLIDLKSIAAYQVSEVSSDTLIIEGWNGDVKEYSSSFLNLTEWQVLNFNYNNIDKIVIKIGSSGISGLTDFNFDNFTFDDPLLSVESIKITDYRMSQNYPNPFNPSTVINYQVPDPGLVKMVVYDIIGNEISTVVNDYKEAGNYSVRFNAENMPSGIYIYKLIAGRFVSTKKMILIK